jgi:curved DNA-binding protein CbpA
VPPTLPSRRFLSEEEYRLFTERIARSLAARPVELGRAEHRERVAALLRQVGEASFYDLLDIDPAASAREVHEAYERMARMVHPGNAPRLDLAGREGVLEVLFERVTGAYLTLSDMDRRKQYDRERPGGWWRASSPSQRVSRGEEAKRLYQKARGFVAAEQYYAAAELLQEALRAESRPEYWVLLGQVQAKNPQWLSSAEESFQRALEMGSTDPTLPASLALVRDQIARQAAGEKIDTDGEVEIL